MSTQSSYSSSSSLNPIHSPSAYSLDAIINALFPDLSAEVFAHYAKSPLCLYINHRILLTDRPCSSGSGSSSSVGFDHGDSCGSSGSSSIVPVKFLIKFEFIFFWLLRCLSSPLLWTILTACALVTRFIKPFSSISAHGKLSSVNYAIRRNCCSSDGENENNNSRIDSQSLLSNLAHSSEANERDNLVNNRYELKSILSSNRLTVPKSYFIHMYAVGLVLGVISCLCLIPNPSPILTSTQRTNGFTYNLFQENNYVHSFLMNSNLLIILFIVQTGRRLIECLWFSSFGDSRMHLFGYLVGLLHYVSTCATLLVESFHVNASSINSNSTSRSSSSQGRSIIFSYIKIVALVMFIASSIGQFMHNRVLFSMKLRMNRRSISSSSSGDSISHSVDNVDDNSSVSCSNSSSGVNNSVSNESGNKSRSGSSGRKRSVSNKKNHSGSITIDTSTSTSTTTIATAIYSSSASTSSNFKKRYDIPSELLFSYVACPHYLFEILIYLSFFLLTYKNSNSINSNSNSNSIDGSRSIDSSSNINGISGHSCSSSVFFVFLWVLTNQAIVADRQFVWYRDNNQDEMKKREMNNKFKRLIPFIW